MRKIYLPILLTAVAISMTGCDKTRETLGLKRVQEDEFQVMDRQPLSVPPNSELRPPVPNAPAKTEVNPTKKAQEALMGEGEYESQKSDAESALLADAKADQNDTDVRAKLADEAADPEEKAPGEDLVVWKDKKADNGGDVIDPRAENALYNGTEMPTQKD